MKSQKLLILMLCLAVPGPGAANMLRNSPNHMLGAPPPVAPAAPPEAPWDPSPAPFILGGDPIFVLQDRHITRALDIQSRSALNVAAGHTLTVDGPVASVPTTMGGLYKLGAGRMVLSGHNSYRGNSALLQGTLVLNGGQALGRPTNALDINVGTRLEFSPGITVDNAFNIRAVDLAMQIPGHWWAPVPPGPDPLAVQWAVEQGQATHRGDLFGSIPLIKLGQGTLRLSGLGAAYDGAMTVRQGELRVDGTFGGPVNVAPGTVLSGTGMVGQLNLAGTLNPGSAQQPGTLTVNRRVDMDPSAITRIRIDASGQADQLRSYNAVHLNGALHVLAQPGAWDESTRWTIVQADAGLEPGEFASTTSNLPYYTPILEYTPDRVILAMRRNQVALETCARPGSAHAAAHIIDQDVPALENRLASQDCDTAAQLLTALAHSGAAAWRSALIDDSRHVREAALAQAGSGRAWARQWMVSAERDARHGGEQVIRGDARDILGLLVGIDRPVATDWHLSLFAGAQHVDYSSSDHPRAPGRLTVRSTSMHLGLGLSHSTALGHRLSIGAAHAWHHSPSQRRTLPGDEALHATQQARSLQAWLEWRLEHVPTERWTFTPLARLAWVRLDSRDYTEQGGPAALHVQGQIDQRIQTHLAWRAHRAWPTPHGTALFHAALGWDALLGSRELSSTQSFRDGKRGLDFEAGGQPLARHALRLDLAVDAPLAPRVRAGIGYTGRYQHDGLQHGILLSLGVAL